MTWYINDLSLAGQYPDGETFLADLRELIRLRRTIPVITERMYCSRRLHSCPVSPTNDFRQAVASDKTLKRLVLEWINKQGPFWDDERQSNPDDYFEYNGQNITDQGLGEAARRQIAGRQAVSFSFQGSGFDYSPLEVIHGLPEAPISHLTIANIWRFNDLQASASQSTPPPVNWKQVVDTARIRFDKLYFATACISELESEPFNQSVVGRIYDLLGVLQEYMDSLDDGIRTQRSHELINQYFSGEKAWFSNESETNQRDFREELSFPDPTSKDKKIFCPWHGKIKSPQYRIHFEWPEITGSKIRIYYIGPKITKR